MKQLFLLPVIILISHITLYSQELIIPNKPYSILDSSPGYITINEFTTGFGVGDTRAPYSKSFFGINTIHGYQINRNFIFAAGTGVSFYNGGTLIPAFLDLRFHFSLKTISPYFAGDGGLFLNPSGAAKLFISPGAGFRYSISKKLCLNFGAGFLVQVAEGQDSFVNLKIGIAFKPGQGE
jgi:hypothetical protein